MFMRAAAVTVHVVPFSLTLCVVRERERGREGETDRENLFLHYADMTDEANVTDEAYAL